MTTEDTEVHGGHGEKSIIAVSPQDPGNIENQDFKSTHHRGTLRNTEEKPNPFYC
jgi:hypothetical protein